MALLRRNTQYGKPICSSSLYEILHMQKPPLFLIICSVFFLCNNSSEKNNELLAKIDSLTVKLNTIAGPLKKDGSLAHVKKVTNSKPQTSFSQPYSPKQIKNPIEVKPVVKVKKNDKSSNKSLGNTFYYFKMHPKGVSVEITPWENGKRKVLFFNPFGDTTYVCYDERLSYIIITQLKKFHENGAVSKIDVHNNPGASLNWYEMEISFDINNNPQWKTVNKGPEMSLEECTNNKYWWNDKSKKWILQEIAKEQALPHR